MLEALRAIARQDAPGAIAKLRAVSQSLPLAASSAPLREIAQQWVPALARRRAMNPLVVATAPLVLGAGIGAGLMYLLDPESGKRRRAAVRDTLASVGQQAKNGIDTASREITSLASRLTSEEPRGEDRKGEEGGAGTGPPEHERTNPVK
jgi:hypothetical protein